MELNETGQVGELVARFDRDAMAEIAAIHVLGGIVELRHRGRHGAGHARADEEGDQFDDGEENSYPQQDVRHALNEFSEGSE